MQNRAAARAERRSCAEPRSCTCRNAQLHVQKRAVARAVASSAQLAVAGCKVRRSGEGLTVRDCDCPGQERTIINFCEIYLPVHEPFFSAYSLSIMKLDEVQLVQVIR